MIKLDVFGSCVSRDALRFAPQDTYQIYAELHKQSIPSLFSRSLCFDETKINWENAARWETKQLIINLNSLAIDLLKNSKGEWLLLDLAEDRFDLCNLKSEENDYYYTYSPILQRMKQKFFDNHIFNDNKFNIIKFDEVPWEKLEKDYRKFAAFISQKYTQEKIIIVEVLEATHLFKNNLELVYFPSETRDRTNAYLKKVYTLLKKLLPRAHYIKMPQNTLMSPNHTWGTLPLHYQESYYHYVLEAIDNITHNRMTYTVEQLYKKQNKKNLFLNRIIEIQKRDKSYQVALGDVKEYRKEISKLEEQIQWLQRENALEKIRNQKPNGDISKSIIQLPKDLCSGCGACDNACPINAINMEEDEYGFLYPSVDREKCRNCGYCANVCPRLNLRYKNSEKKFCLAVMADDKTRKNSSSGGVFQILAEYVLDKQGYVCGAVWNENWGVEHILTDKKEEILKMQGSKYLQSNINKIYQKIETILRTGKYVLFSGTPCEVDGLLHFLGKDYENLISMDILCHGVPSQKTFLKYLESEYKNRTIKNIYFRDKRQAGWGSYTTIEFADGTSINMNTMNDMWMTAFLNLYMHRDSCYHCAYTKTRRVGDFTAGDFWGIGNYYPQYNDGKGTSVLTLNNEKAVSIFEEIKERFKLKEWMHIENSIPANSAWVKNKIEPKKRKVFLDALQTGDYCEELENVLYDKKVWDIGIVGWWYYYNYGSILTYFALNRALRKMGHTVLMIHHTNNGPRASKLANAFPENFIKKYCDISHFYNDENMRLLNKRCKAFISGSDQLWNPLCEKDAGKEFFLDFADDEHVKLSYASSLGNETDASAEFKKKYAPMVQRFQGVSVRESMGIQACENIYGVKPKKVCDPVFLCDKNEFIELANNSALKLNSKRYLLSFILDPDENKKRMIEEKAAALSVEYINLVDLTDAGEKARRLGLPNTIPFAPVEDFLNYFLHASYVITDSFHGTCFSVIFNKEFISVANYGRGEKRVAELLNWLNLEDRILYDSTINVQKFQPEEIDYRKVNAIIEKAKKFSYEWLEKKLKQL